MIAARISQALRPLRAGMWPIIWLQFCLGAVVSIGPRLSSADWRGIVSVASAGGIWTVCLGGTGAIVLALFADDLQDPAPTATGWVALVLLMVGVASSPVISWNFFDAYLVGVVVIVLYGVPPIRLARYLPAAAVLEGVAAALTLHAGRTAVDTRLTFDRAWILLVLGAFFLVLALRTLFSGVGGRLVAVLYSTCVVNAFVCLALAEGMQKRGLGLAFLAPIFLAWWGAGLRLYAPFAGRGHPPRLATFLALITQAGIALGYVV